MKRLFALLMAAALLLTAVPALAEDVFTLDAASAAQISTDRSFVRVTSAAAHGTVIVEVRDADSNLIYQKNYGEYSGPFRSDELYLPLYGAETVYTVTLTAGDQVSSHTVVRKMPRLTGNTACAAGLPLSVVTGRNSWQSVTVIDLRASEGRTIVMPMLASGSYSLGTVSFTVSGGRVTAQAEISGGIDGTIDSARVYAAANALEAQQLGSRSFSGASGTLGQAISLNGADYAVMYVQLSVSFDPTGVPAAVPASQPGQSDLWQIVNSTTINEAVG